MSFGKCYIMTGYEIVYISGSDRQALDCIARRFLDTYTSNSGEWAVVSPAIVAAWHTKVGGYFVRNFGG